MCKFIWLKILLSRTGCTKNPLLLPPEHSENDTSGPTGVFCATILPRASLACWDSRWSIKDGPLFSLHYWWRLSKRLISVYSRWHGTVSIGGQSFDCWLATIACLALASVWFENARNSVDTIISQDCRPMLLEALLGEPADLRLNIGWHPRVNPILLVLLAFLQLCDQLTLHFARWLRVVDLTRDERIWDRSGGEKLKYPMHTNNINE